MNKSACGPIKHFTDTELQILRCLQRGIAICPAPYAEIAREANCTELEVLSLLQRLKEEKVIRRYGAWLNHRNAGFRHNALLAWNLNGLQGNTINTLGETAAKFKFISHCYLRPGPEPAWPWSLYTMLHAMSTEELHARIDEIWKTLQKSTSTSLQKPLVLKTLEEYKKSSMNYF